MMGTLTFTDKVASFGRLGIVLAVGVAMLLGIRPASGFYHQGRGGEAIEQVIARRGMQDEFVCALEPLSERTDLLQVQNAIWHLQTALRHVPQLVQAYLLLGRAHCLQGDYPAAVEAYLAFTRWRPGYPLAHLEMGFAYEANGNAGEAVGQWQAAGMSAEDFIVRGLAAYRQKQWQAALQWHRRASQMGANLQSNLLYLDYLRLETSGSSAAQEALEQAIRLDRGWGSDEMRFQGWYRWGRILVERNDFTAAIAALQQAIAVYPHQPQLQPTLSEVYRLLGRAEWGQGNLAEALRHHQTAIELNPANVWAHIHYGKVLYLQDPHNLEQTAQQFALALELQPEKIELWLNLIDFWLWKKETNQAAQLCQQAMARWPADAQLGTRCKP